MQKNLTVFYDGACPLCRREIGFYRRRRDADKISWVDVSIETPAGLSRCNALARFHVRGADGEFYSGAAAFARLWRRLPAFRWLGAVAMIPPVTWAMERAYRLFLRLRPYLQKRARGAGGDEDRREAA